MKLGSWRSPESVITDTLAALPAYARTLLLAECGGRPETLAAERVWRVAEYYRQRVSS